MKKVELLLQSRIHRLAKVSLADKLRPGNYEKDLKQNPREKYMEFEENNEEFEGKNTENVSLG
jgi:hypothetical protein